MSKHYSREQFLRAKEEACIVAFTLPNGGSYREMVERWSYMLRDAADLIELVELIRPEAAKAPTP